MSGSLQRYFIIERRHQFRRRYLPIAGLRALFRSHFRSLSAAEHQCLSRLLRRGPQRRQIPSQVFPFAFGIGSVEWVYSPRGDECTAPVIN